MDIKYDNFTHKAHEVHLRFQLEMVAFYKNANTKQDQVKDFISKYVYVNHLNNNKTTVSEIVNVLNETENTIRKKINELEKYNMLIKRVSNKDKRTIYEEPTKVAIRLYEVQATRVLKTILEASPLINSLFKEWADNYSKFYGTEGLPSYYAKADQSFYNDVATMMKQQRMSYLATENILKELG